MPCPCLSPHHKPSPVSRAAGQDRTIHAQQPMPAALVSP
jgi:hypothetical protein